MQLIEKQLLFEFWAQGFFQEANWASFWQVALVQAIDNQAQIWGSF